MSRICVLQMCMRSLVGVVITVILRLEVEVFSSKAGNRVVKCAAALLPVPTEGRLEAQHILQQRPVLLVADALQYVCRAGRREWPPM